MEINNIDKFLNYWSKIKLRTRRIINVIPIEHCDWSYKNGKFTCADIVRHIANIERYLFVENIISGQNKYIGCDFSTQFGYENFIEMFDKLHQESYDFISKLDNEKLNIKIYTPNNHLISVSNWLRAMIEHEIHHRAQLYIYLNMMEIQTHPIFEFTSEEVISLNHKNI